MGYLLTCSTCGESLKLCSQTRDPNLSVTVFSSVRSCESNVSYTGAATEEDDMAAAGEAADDGEDDAPAAVVAAVTVAVAVANAAALAVARR